MNASIRILIQYFGTMLLLIVALASVASASSADPMSRDVEFKESLARQDGSRELRSLTSVSRYLARRTDASKIGRAPK